MRQEPIVALEAEGKCLASLLDSLSPDHWERPSKCAGWSVSDVVLHLAQTEEAVVASLRGAPFAAPAHTEAATVDDVMDAWVAAERDAPPRQVFERWQTAHANAIAALKEADPTQPVAWAAAPLKPRTLATTRLSEHWIHALDIGEPLGVSYPDTERLWHVARLAHRTLPYAYARGGRSDPPTVYMELQAPDGGDTWTFGDTHADCHISGAAGAFCRVAARRLSREEAALETKGDRCDEVLELIRTYA